MNHRPLYNFGALTFFSLLASSSLCPTREGVAFGQSRAPATFVRIRALSLPQVRALALERVPTITIARAKVETAKGAQRELSKRLKVQSLGGLDPFTGKVRFYLSLDLQRLLQLNKEERDKAKHAVEAEQLNQGEAQNGAIASVTSAWFGLQRAEAAHITARRNLITARAIFTSADARFRAGTGELGSVLSALSARTSGEDAVTSTRQNLLLACLSLAQACGYPTAEEMEGALPVRPTQAGAAKSAKGAATSGAGTRNPSAAPERFGALRGGQTTPDETRAQDPAKEEDAQNELKPEQTTFDEERAKRALEASGGKSAFPF